MEINDLYSIAENKGHDIVSLRLTESPAFSIEDNVGRCHIAMSNDLSSLNKKVLLAHELGHCEYGGFYNYHSKFELRSRCENRADRWSYLKLVPFTELKELTQQGHELWEIADHFDVPVEFLHSAIKFYTETLGRRL